MPLSPDRPDAFVRDLTSYYGTDWLTWSQEIFTLTLREAFGYDPVAELGEEAGALKLEKAEALRELVRSDRFYDNPVVFENVAHALSETHFTHGVWEPCEPYEIALALAVAARATGAAAMGAAEAGRFSAQPERYSDAVRAYVATCLVSGGVHAAAENFGFGIARKEIGAASGTAKEARLKALAAWGRAFAWGRGGAVKIAERAAAEVAPGDAESDPTYVRTLARLSACAIQLERRGFDLAEVASLYAVRPADRPADRPAAAGSDANTSST